MLRLASIVQQRQRDHKRLGDVHVTSDPSYARAGIHLLPDDGGAPVRVPPDVAMHPKRPGCQPVSGTPPALLGQLPDGRCLLRVPMEAGAGGEGAFLYAVHLTTNIGTSE